MRVGRKVGVSKGMPFYVGWDTNLDSVKKQS